MYFNSCSQAVFRASLLASLVRLLLHGGKQRLDAGTVEQSSSCLADNTFLLRSVPLKDYSRDLFPPIPKESLTNTCWNFFDDTSQSGIHSKERWLVPN